MSSFPVCQSSNDPLIALRDHFGFDSFREGQKEVIDGVLSGNDVMVVMPTGSGKSLCYQLPATIFKGATLVVSPLIALMKDQVEALEALRIPAAFINSSIPEVQQLARIDLLKQRKLKLIYVAPERFKSPRFMAALRSVEISLFAIDEAHCVSTWGHDFRPDYLRLRTIIQSLGNIQTVALTATATPYVRSDIIQQLGLRKPLTFVSGFDRPNLAIKVAHTDKVIDKIGRIVSLARNNQGSGIIYASTRKAVEELGSELKHHGLNVSVYHAGMTDAVRGKAQDDFMSDKTQLIVATNAFGMGIDKRDIRFVAHYQMPGSIEAYYQEIGRAGRDGLPSQCHLLFNYADKNTHDFFIDGSYPELSMVQDVYDALLATGVRQVQLSSRELAARSGVRNELAVQSSLYLLERAGHIQRIATSNNNFRDDKSSRRNRSILILDPKRSKLRVDAEELKRRGDFERRKLREMIEFCYTSTCYRAHILDYFGDRHHSRQCGTCGNCAPTRNSPSIFVASSKSKNPAPVSTPRALNDDELLRVRKLLACAKRMKGRFGKKMLAATVRGSAAKNVMRAGLNKLSTYGLLKDMKQDEIEIYIDALEQAGCFRVTSGDYPTVAITDSGERVMREQEPVQLMLPTREKTVEVPSHAGSDSHIPTETMLSTYELYKSGLKIADIANERDSTTGTIEEHLIGCVRAGLQVDLNDFVHPAQRILIEQAIATASTTRLKPIRDLLPDDITYNMIRFVAAERQRMHNANTVSPERQ